MVKAGTVTDTEGKSYPTKLVTPVPKETEAVSVPDFRGRALRDNRTQDALRKFALELHAKLVSKGETALTSITKMMSEDFRKAKPSTLQIQDFIKLYPNLFKYEGEAQQMKIKAIRRRITGKSKP